MELDVTRSELEDLIDAMMMHRLNHDGDIDDGIRLSALHLKLEERLELWINGGLVEVPIPPNLQGLGIASIHIDYPPHDEGVTRGD